MDQQVVINAAIWGASGILYALGGVRWHAGLSAKGRLMAVFRLQERIGLDAGGEMTSKLAERLGRDRRIIVASVGIATVAVVASTLALPGFASVAGGTMTVFFFIASIGVGTSIASVVGGFRLDPDRPRVARLTQPSAADYADRRVTTMTRLLVAGGSLLTVAAIANGAAAVPYGVLALIAIACLPAAELTAIRLARHPQHAHDLDELRWDDALRASAVNGLYAAPALFAGIALMAAGLDLTTRLAGDDASGPWTMAMIAIALSGTVFAATGRFEARALARIWPAANLEPDRGAA